MRCTLRSTGGLTATSTGVHDRHAHRLPCAAAADQQRIVSGLDVHNGRGLNLSFTTIALGSSDRVISRV